MPTEDDGSRDDPQLVRRWADAGVLVQATHADRLRSESEHNNSQIQSGL